MFDLTAALRGFSSRPLADGQAQPSRYQGLRGGIGEAIQF
jgi:hypothetical protein